MAKETQGGWGNPHAPGALLWLSGLLAVGLTACQTPSKQEVQTTTPTARFLGAETIKVLEAKVFLECIEPQAREMAERKISRSGMERSDYYNDRANKDRPVTLPLPDIFTVGLEEFNKVSTEVAGRGLHFSLQLRERSRVLRAKSYELQVSVRGEDGRATKKSVDQVQYPRFYDWAWNPQRLVQPSRRVGFVVENLLDATGAATKGEGLMDMDGIIKFDLRPYIELGAAEPDGLLFSFACPSVGAFCKVRVEADVFEAHR